ncbi:unnamed protein product [Microthlaspi erraticum]|uniref:TF-B3 domain-containing protein n=1 Tax=Microthlaspi erraticum TaxID=1685480 RepID=A0A6D2JHA0_9BRAS|nr:unnamed protein product [Microthlaspi erraticum]
MIVVNHKKVKRRRASWRLRKRRISLTPNVSEERLREKLGDAKLHLHIGCVPLVNYSFIGSKHQIFAQSLPLSFTRANGLNKSRKITLLGEDGVKQVVDLLQENKTGILRFGKGWRYFCEAMA